MKKLLSLVLAMVMLMACAALLWLTKAPSLTGPSMTLW